jgi:hypothetical protein
MNRASPVDLRKAMDATLTLFKAGVLFVPMPVLNGDDHLQLVMQCQDRLEQMEQEAEVVASVPTPAPPVPDEPAPAPPTMHYFINYKSRMCKILQGRDALHLANMKQAKKEGFVEVTQEHQAEFQVDTAKARALGWKPFGRTSYATFMGRLKSE